jgi:hypothetical protein
VVRLDWLQLKAKKLKELKQKEREQKLRRMKQKGQKRIFKGVPYYDMDNYKKHMEDPKSLTHNESVNIEKGQKRVDATLEELAKKYPTPEYRIWANPATGRGADIVVEKKDDASFRYKPYEVYELTNYTRTGYISQDDIERYQDTLKQFNCKRKLVVSYEDNLFNRRTKADYRKQLEKNGIEVEVKGEIPLEENRWNLWGG